MTFELAFLLQSPHNPTIYESLYAAITDPAFQRLRIAVAFATEPGVMLLQRALDNRPTPISVQLLVGLDGYITEPAALDRLAHDPRVDLRVFLSPADTMFHAKVYLLDGSTQTVAIVGSCNLSAAGLTRNRESAVTLSLPSSHSSLDAWEAWWAQIWTLGNQPTDALLAWYRTSHQTTHRPRRRTIPTAILEPLRLLPAQGDRLWIGTASMTGGGVTQLELPRETVPFFQIDPQDDEAAQDLILLRPSQRWPDNRLTFYPNNDMWRINLSGQIPEVATKTLPYRYVLFVRTQEPRAYQFHVLTEPEASALRQASRALDQYGETPARDFGWL